jgi:hypothetical protein
MEFGLSRPPPKIQNIRAVIYRKRNATVPIYMSRNSRVVFAM